MGAPALAAKVVLALVNCRRHVELDVELVCAADVAVGVELL